MVVSDGGDETRPSCARSTAPPPFDPEQYARESEDHFRGAEADGERRFSTNPPPTLDIATVVPVRRMSADELAWFDVDSRLLRLFLLVDGTSTAEQIASGCPDIELDPIAGLAELAELGFVELPEPKEPGETPERESSG